jgi:hypothetical protein
MPPSNSTFASVNADLYEAKHLQHIANKPACGPTPTGQSCFRRANTSSARPCSPTNPNSP